MGHRAETVLTLVYGPICGPWRAWSASWPCAFSTNSGTNLVRVALDYTENEPVAKPDSRDQKRRLDSAKPPTLNRQDICEVIPPAVASDDGDSIHSLHRELNAASISHGDLHYVSTTNTPRRRLWCHRCHDRGAVHAGATGHGNGRCAQRADKASDTDCADGTHWDPLFDPVGRRLCSLMPGSSGKAPKCTSEPRLTLCLVCISACGYRWNCRCRRRL